MTTSRPIRFILNNREICTTEPPGMVLLDFLRHNQRLTGTKEGCREGDCGACMILLGELESDYIHYKAVTSCLLPLGDVHGKHVVTIEGLNSRELTPIQQAIVQESATQCGFCTPGIVISLTGFFLNSRRLDEEEAIRSVDGNICRCTGYLSIKRAARLLSQRYRPAEEDDTGRQRLESLVRWRVLPAYFLDIPERLRKLNSEPGMDLLLEGLNRQVVAGGTDLFVQRADELVDKELLFLSRRRGMRGIRIHDGACHIAAGTTVEALADSEELHSYLPGLKSAWPLIASSPIRSRATVGGNIVNASPIGDLTIIFLALDAELVLSDGNDSRRVPLKRFFRGYKSLDRRKDEIITEIIFKIPDEHSLFHFEKVSKRTYLDIASVNSAMLIRLEKDVIQDVHISAGGVAPIPLYLQKTVDFLRGKPLTSAHIHQATSIARSEVSPISDVRGSAVYKRLLLRQLILAHFMELFPQNLEVLI